jgi:hypothetical protein
LLASGVELLHELTRARAQHFRHGETQLHTVMAGAGTKAMGHPHALDAQFVTGARPGRDAHGLRPAQRFHIYLGSEHRLHERNGNLTNHVVAVSRKQRIWINLNHEFEVTGWRARRRSAAPAGDR